MDKNNSPGLQPTQDPVQEPDDPGTTRDYHSLASTVGAASTAQVAERTDQRRGQFTLLRPHAKGGLGQVSIARDEKLGRHVALKEIRSDRSADPYLRQRFLTEAAITGQLEHPGIVPIYALDADASGQPYYAMRFIQGQTLSETIRAYHGESTPLVFRELLNRFVSVCQTMAYAHSKGVIHRDLKPANVMVGEYGETLVVDWGLAKQCSPLAPREESEVALALADAIPGLKSTEQSEDIGREDSNRSPHAEREGYHEWPELTAAGAVLGTPAYMSPEQAAGHSDEIGPATDIYALGAILYELLCNRPPYAGSGGAQAALDCLQLGQPPTRPSQLERNIPNALEAICLKAMQHTVDARYATAAELAHDVDRFLADEPVTAHAEPAIQRTRRWLRKHPRTVATLAATLLVSLASSLAIASVVSRNAEVVAGKNTQLLSKNEELRKSNEAETHAKEDALAVLEFFEKNVLARARPETQDGGLGIAATIRDALDASEPEIAGSFTGRPLVEASIRNTLGATYLYLGEAELAIRQHERARNLRELEFGLVHPDTLKSINNLAVAYQSAGKLDLAVPLFEQTLELKKSRLGPEHRASLESMNNLAMAYQSAGKVDQAVALFEQILAVMKTKLGADDALTLTTMNNLGMAYLYARKPEQALPVFEQTLELRKARLPPKHPDTLVSMNSLAVAYQSAGKLDQALPLLEQALELRKAILGPEHPHTLASMNDLANAYRSAGKLELSLPYLEQTLLLRTAKLGPEHPDTLASMNSLAIAYLSTGKFDQALPLFVRTIELRKAKQGSDHPDTLVTMNNLAYAYVSAGKVDQALPLYEQTLELFKAKQGPEHPDTLTSINNLAGAYLQSEQPEMALPLFEEFFTGKRKRAKPDDAELASWLAQVSKELLKHRQHMPAENYLRESLAIREKTIPDAWQTFNAQNMLGGALAGQRMFAEAEPLLLAGYEGMKQRQDKIPATAKSNLTDALQRLVDLYTAWDKPNDAEKWRKELDSAKTLVPNTRP